MRIVYGDVGWRVLQGMHRAVAAYAAVGANVIVDDMLLDRRVLADWADALDGIDVLLVRLAAPLGTLLAQEAARTRRRTPGLVAGHRALHDGVRADLVVDTSLLEPARAADLILEQGFPPTAAGALTKYRTPDVR